MKLQNTLLAVSGAFIIAAGCSSLPSVGPDYAEPVIKDIHVVPPDAGYPTTNKTASGEFKAAETNEDPRIQITKDSLVRWWAKFNDETLNALISAAVSNNLSFLMAREKLEQARWQLVAARSSYAPQINFDGTASRSGHHRYNSSRYDAKNALHRNLFESGFDARWEIDIFGGVRRDVERATAAMEAANFTLADAWVTLTAEIGRQYINLRTTQQRIGVARANLKLQDETFDILKSRLDSGIGDELAVSQSKYVVEQTRAHIPPLLAEEEMLKNALAILVGTMPGALHDILAELPQRDWLLAPQQLANIPMDLLRARPDVRAAERSLATQVAAVGVAKSLLFPKFFINGTLGLESVNHQHFFNRQALYGTIGPSFSWPIFQGGNLIANLHTEEAKMNEACLKYELSVQTAAEEVRNSYAAYTQEYHRYQSLQGAVKAATEAVTISKNLYANGLKDFNNVLDAQRSLLDLDESLTVSRGEITLNLMKVYKALGGGLTLSEE